MGALAPAVSDQARKVIQDLTRQMSAHLKSLQLSVPAAGKYFELKGSLIVFRDTAALAKDLHAFMTTARNLVRQVVPKLRRAADDVNRAGRAVMVQLISRGALGLSAADPSVAKLVEVLAQFGAADLAGTAAGELSGLLRRCADTLEKKSKSLDKSRMSVRFGMWASFGGNAFNWKTRRFEAQGISPLASLANRKFNARIAALEAKQKRQGPGLPGRYYAEFLMKKFVDLGMALATAALVAAALGALFEDLTMIHPG